MKDYGVLRITGTKRTVGIRKRKLKILVCIIKKEGFENLTFNGYTEC